MPDVLIAEGHPRVRDALTRAVHVALPKATIHSAADMQGLLASADAFPDAQLLLLDLHMPGAGGYSALVRLRGQHPGLPVIVIAADEEAPVARHALAYGAAAYIPKSTPVAVIVVAIHAVLAGGVWLPRIMLRADAARSANGQAATARIAALTPRQFRVLTMLADGKLNKQMAWELGVSEATVKAHMTAIMRKLGANNRTQAALIARGFGVDPGAPLAPAPGDAG